MTCLNALPHGLDEAAFTCRAIVETPQGARAKFVYDPESRLFKLGKLLPAGLSFPVHFGFVPSTLAPDGDPLDLMVLPEVDLPVGCLVEVRLLGAIEVEQWWPGEKRVRNDRLLVRTVESNLFSELENMADLPAGYVEQLCEFFRVYKTARGQALEVIGMGGPTRAVELIRQCSQAA